MKKQNNNSLVGIKIAGLNQRQFAKNNEIVNHPPPNEQDMKDEVAIVVLVLSPNTSDRCEYFVSGILKPATFHCRLCEFV